MIGQRRGKRAARHLAVLLLVAGPVLWWILAPSTKPPEPIAPHATPEPAAKPAPGAEQRIPVPGAPRPDGLAQPSNLDAVPDREDLPLWLARLLGERASRGEPLVSNRSLSARPFGSGDPPFDPRDLAVLQELIDANGLSEGSSPSDYDDGNGRFEPWELGTQVWQGTRLVSLSLGPDPHASFGYGLEQVPDSLGELDALVQLDLSGNRVEILPESLGDLRELRELRLNRNAFEELPASTGELDELVSLNVSQNELRGLPDEMRWLPVLEELYLDDNPISQLPEPVLEIGTLSWISVTHSAAGFRAGVAAPGGLVELPSDWLARRERPVVVNVAGNQLCQPDLAQLGFGGSAQVFGLSAQRCAGFAAP
jgi:hypothetical protein